MKLKMDINRWRTAADLTVLEREPMYAGSMYVHKLIVKANLYDTDKSKENLRASFSVNGEAVAQNVPLVKIDSQDCEFEQCEDGYALYEALIPSILFKAEQRVNMSIALCTVVDGVFSQILTTSPIQFVIEGDASMFENQMSEEDRHVYDGQLSEIVADLNDMKQTVTSVRNDMDTYQGPQGPQGPQGVSVVGATIQLVTTENYNY